MQKDNKSGDVANFPGNRAVDFTGFVKEWRLCILYMGLYAVHVPA